MRPLSLAVIALLLSFSACGTDESEQPSAAGSGGDSASSGRAGSAGGAGKASSAGTGAGGSRAGSSGGGRDAVGGSGASAGVGGPTGGASPAGGGGHAGADEEGAGTPGEPSSGGEGGRATSAGGESGGPGGGSEAASSGESNGGSSGETGGGANAGASSGGTGGGGPNGGQGGTSAEEFGVLSGEVGSIDEAAVLGSNPRLFESTIDFGTAQFDSALLSADARRLLEAAAVGGSSAEAHAIAFEILRRGAGATLLKTSEEISYTTSSKSVDFLVEIQGQRVGVSVTRATSFPLGSDLSLQSASNLLEQKLNDILLASAGVAPSDAWVKAILLVLAYDAQKHDVVLEAYSALDSMTRSDTLVLVTQTDGDDAFLY